MKKKNFSLELEITAGVLIILIGLVVFVSSFAGTITGQSITSTLKKIVPSTTSALKTSTGTTTALPITHLNLDLVSLQTCMNLVQVNAQKYSSDFESKISQLGITVANLQKNGKTQDVKKAMITFTDDPILRQKLKDYITAKQACDTLIDQAWQQLAPPSTFGITLTQPVLQLASLTLQKELQNRLEPNFRTTLLAAPQICKSNHLISDQSFYRALQEEISIAPDQARLKTPIKQIATFSHCAAPRDIFLLDQALWQSTNVVLHQLETHGYAQTKGQFLRLQLNPLLPFYDVCKSKGIFCYVSDTLETNYKEIIQSLQSSTWPTQSTYLIDRRSGALVTIPSCTTPSPSACFDPITMINSFRDPRALQLGQCSIVDMLIAGPKDFNLPEITSGQTPSSSTTSSSRTQRYLCPSDPCKQEAQSPTPPSSLSTIPSTRSSRSSGSFQTFQDQIRNRWPSTTDQDLQDMKKLCQDTLTSPLGYPTTGNCNQLFAQTTPQDQYLQCITKAIGLPGTLGTQPLGEQLNGVPLGKKCQLKGESTAEGSSTRENVGIHMTGSERRGNNVMYTLQDAAGRTSIMTVSDDGRTYGCIGQVDCRQIYGGGGSGSTSTGEGSYYDPSSDPATADWDPHLFRFAVDFVKDLQIRLSPDGNSIQWKDPPGGYLEPLSYTRISGRTIHMDSGGALLFFVDSEIESLKRDGKITSEQEGDLHFNAVDQISKKTDEERKKTDEENAKERAGEEGSSPEEGGFGGSEDKGIVEQPAPENCPDWNSCISSCSALGQEIAKVEKCSENLIQAGLLALGTPRKQVQPGTRPPIDRAYLIDVKQTTTPTPGDCLPTGSTAPSGSFTAGSCALVMCTNAASATGCCGKTSNEVSSALQQGCTNGIPSCPSGAYTNNNGICTCLTEEQLTLPPPGRPPGPGE